jgi:hypothetical protein
LVLFEIGKYPSVYRQRKKSIQIWINKSIPNQETSTQSIHRQTGYSERGIRNTGSQTLRKVPVAQEHPGEQEFTG